MRRRSRIQTEFRRDPADQGEQPRHSPSRWRRPTGETPSPWRPSWFSRAGLKNSARQGQGAEDKRGRVHDDGPGHEPDTNRTSVTYTLRSGTPRGNFAAKFTSIRPVVARSISFSFELSSSSRSALGPDSRRPLAAQIPTNPPLQPAAHARLSGVRHSRRHAYGGGAPNTPPCRVSVLNHSAALTSLHAMSRSNSAPNWS